MDKEATQIRVLIVDDHPIMRVGIAAIINAQAGMHVVDKPGRLPRPSACSPPSSPTSR
jgi:DNA-binding NarL/FixJ family response regulator